MLYGAASSGLESSQPQLFSSPSAVAGHQRPRKPGPCEDDMPSVTVSPSFFHPHSPTLSQQAALLPLHPPQPRHTEPCSDDNYCRPLAGPGGHMPPSQRVRIDALSPSPSYKWQWAPRAEQSTDRPRRSLLLTPCRPGWRASPSLATCTGSDCFLLSPFQPGIHCP
jgi:hypothetical protein